MDHDIVIVDADTASIGTAHGLTNRGLSMLLIDTTDRVDGRTHNVRFGETTIDLNCGYLHSAEHNGWTALDERLGFTVDRSDPN